MYGKTSLYEEVPMGKILLFYKYTLLDNPKRMLKWQRKICTDLRLTGRILIGTEGINATVGGTDEHVARYIEIMRQEPCFADIDFKQSEGGADCFPKLVIKIRDEIVTLGIPAQQLGSQQGGIHLSPDQTHQLLTDNPDDLVVLDARNDFEWQVGRFTNAILPPIQNFREFPEYIEKNLDQFKNKKVLMYCTGGVRCERATALLKVKGVAKEIYQMEGGICKYAEKYPDGYFRGKNYVFDGRVTQKVNEDVFGHCYICNSSCDEYTNCANALCNRHFIGCADCISRLQNTCSSICQQLVSEKKVATRPKGFKAVIQTI